MPHRVLQIHAPGGLWPPTWPMGLTMLRLLLLPVFLWALLAHGRGSARPMIWVPVAIYGVMAITDKLDGWLARRLNQITRLGTILDPVADKLLIGCSVILLSFESIAGASFAIPEWVVWAVYGKDVVVVLGTIAMLKVVGKVSIRPRPIGKISTFAQLTMVMAVLVAPASASSLFHPWLTFVQILWWLVTAIAVGAAIDYLIQGFTQFFEWKRGNPAEAQTSEIRDLKSEI